MRKLFILLMLTFLTVGNCWGGVDFDNVDDKITLAGTGRLNSDTLGSVSAWINLDSLANNTTRAILGYGGSGTSSNGKIWKFEVRYRNGDARRVGIIAGKIGANYNGVLSSAILNLNTWYHVAVTSSGTVYKIYVNGVEGTNSDWLGVNDGAWLGNIGAVDPDYSSIGTVFFEGAWGTAIDGEIKEVKLWSTELSAGEVLAEYNAKVKGYISDSGNLRNYWRLDDCSDGVSCDGLNFIDMIQGNAGTGDDGANNTGFTGVAETQLTYP